MEANVSGLFGFASSFYETVLPKSLAPIGSGPVKGSSQRLAGQIVDLHRRRAFPGVLEWGGGRIRRITPDDRVKDKLVIAPGFVDAHIHIESSLLPPVE